MISSDMITFKPCRCGREKDHPTDKRCRTCTDEAIEEFQRRRGIAAGDNDDEQYNKIVEERARWM